MADKAQERESFRDHIATVDKEGKRVWIYPAKPKGRLHRARGVVATLLLIFMFAAPFIRLGDRPFLLFDILDRKFVLFGHIFWPQDFYLFVLATITFVIFIVLFTVVYGRLWCGWACPQTVFMEMVFRKIEYWIEGNSGRQRVLDRAPLDATKFLKKLAKHVIYFVISFIVGNTTLAYMIGIERLQLLIQDGPAAHLTTFMAVVAFSGLTYFIFARFREQVCIIVCPYGRLQSVLLDSNSIVVAYDHKRGEPRGPLDLKKPRNNLGNCVDCGNCVTVCPTGIDIRNGTQLECVNCTACIDSCNIVMAKVGFPKGLIRYASHNGISEGKRLKANARMIGYSMILAVLLAVFVALLVTRKDLQATILRTPGQMYQELAEGKIRNLYSFKAINKTFKRLAITLRLPNRKGEITMIGGDLVLLSGGVAESAFFVDIPQEELNSAHEEFQIDVFGNDKLMAEIRTKFLGPRPQEKDHDEEAGHE